MNQKKFFREKDKKIGGGGGGSQGSIILVVVQQFVALFTCIMHKLCSHNGTVSFYSWRLFVMLAIILFIVIVLMALFTNLLYAWFSLTKSLSKKR